MHPVPDATTTAPPRLITAVPRDGGCVEVVTEFEALSPVPWAALSPENRGRAVALITEIHGADVEVAAAPASVRAQLLQSLPEEIDPCEYAATVRAYLAAARRDCAELGRG
ncbi:unnamed protein product [Gemmataceae bacterium]|nr:unnamed protein product [Gemmataceae bacterium]VTT99161.1 unnamed protein product [Gemmataceae bacterium]